jgi:hypothetical protein
MNTFILGAIFITIKVILYYVFLGNPGDPVEICINKNKYTISTLFTSHLSAKNVFLNFGVLYLFALYLFISGRWKKFNTPDLKKKLFINLTIIPYTLLGIYITYIDEVRVYTELIPMYTTLFLILVSTFEKLPLVEKR